MKSDRRFSPESEPPRIRGFQSAAALDRAKDEWAPKIRLNAIVVGQVLTEGAQMTMGEELLAETASNIPLKRLGNVRDIAACALYLASPASSWVTADVIEVNGGTEAPPVEFPVPSL